MPDQPHASRLPEPIGYLCRWCLLGACGLATVGLGALALSAADSLLIDRHARILLPDGLWQSDHEQGVHLTGYTRPHRGTDTTLWPLSGSAGGALHLPHGYDDVIWVHTDPQGGRVRQVVARGGPYGALAFVQAQARAVVIPRGQAVFAVDARLARDAQRDNPAELRACLAALSRAGQVALFHPGPESDYLADAPAVAELRRRYPLTYIFHHPYRPVVTLGHVRWTLHRPSSAVTVVTGDAVVARAAADVKFPVYLISADAPADARRPGITNLSSLGKLKETLRTSSISQEPAGPARNPARPPAP